MFKDIIGHQTIKQRLIRTVTEKRIPHAQLFHGKEGVGKLAMAIAYAQYISCQHPTPTDACGKCPSCLKYKLLAHPDLHFVFPVIKASGKKTAISDDFIQVFRTTIAENPYIGIDDWYEKIGGEGKKGMIYVSESNEIIKKINLKPYESTYKTMIIWLPELMHTSLANKLLKIIEEPPPYTLFLLVSNRPMEIISTISSRTQPINIPPLSTDELTEGLTLHYPETKITNIQNAIKIAEGSYLKAQKILQSTEENNTNFERFTQLMRYAWLVGNKQDYEALKQLRKWAENIASKSIGGEKQRKFLTYAQHMVRENFIRNINKEQLNYMTDYEQKFSQNFAPFINERNVEQLQEELNTAEIQIGQNANPKIVFFDLALKIIMMIKK